MKNMSIVKKVAAITLACAMALTVSPVMNAGAKSGHWYYRGVAKDDQTDSFKYLRGSWYYRGEGWETPATPEIDNALKADKNIGIINAKSAGIIHNGICNECSAEGPRPCRGQRALTRSLRSIQHSWRKLLFPK